MNLYVAIHHLRTHKAKFIYLNGSDFKYHYNDKSKTFSRCERFGSGKTVCIFKNMIDYLNDVDVVFMNWYCQKGKNRFS